MKQRDVIEGVAEGVVYFLEQHPISVVDPMMEAISKAVAREVRGWMDANEDAILDRIAAAHDPRNSEGFLDEVSAEVARRFRR